MIQFTTRKKEPNKKHHQYNKPLNPRQRFAGRCNWLLFQITGAKGSLLNSGQQVVSAFKMMPVADQDADGFAAVIVQWNKILMELDELAKRIKALSGK